MKLILIRHGNTEANEKHLYCGSTDLSLSDAGKAALLERKTSVGIPAADGPMSATVRTPSWWERPSAQ